MNFSIRQAFSSTYLLSRRMWPWLVWGTAALVILALDWFSARVIAAIFLLYFLPGWAWLEAGLPQLKDGVWRLLLAAGLSLVLSSLGALYLVYLPGPTGQLHLLALSAALTLSGLLLSLKGPPVPLVWPKQETWLLLLLVLGLAVALRLPRLGYAEFHEDEVEVMSLAVRAGQGTDYALFLHRKGPLQILVPLSGWLLTGRLSEGWARLPFMLAALTGILMITYLAHQTSGRVAGLTTGLLLALNGYLIVFSRIVQYQALVLILSSLGLICLWYALKKGEIGLIWPGTLSLAASLLAHFDGLLYLPVALYLAWRIWQARPAARRTLLLAGVMATVVIVSFYLPYIQDPQFEHTKTYLLESRVETGWFHNNLRMINAWDRDYASRFYLPVLWGLVLIVIWRHKPAPQLWRLVLIGALVAAFTTIAWPDIWQVGDFNLAIIPWTVLLGIGGLGLRQGRAGAEFFWLWWAVPLVGYTFLVGDPRTHIYVAYPGWAMVAGLGVAGLWQTVRIRPVLVVVGVTLAFLVAGYEALIFFPTEPAFIALREGWSNGLTETVYGPFPKLIPRARFGYPRHVGWKAVGRLMATQQISNDFRTVGEDFSVPIWYTFETPRSCFDTPETYLIAQPLDTLDDTLRQKLETAYTPGGTIYTENVPRITLYTKGGGNISPTRYDAAGFERGFDAISAVAQFAGLKQPTHPAAAQFGGVAKLTGFSLSSQSLAENEVLTVDLYWESLAETDIRYRAFVHLGQNPAWSQHDDDPACRLPITLWRKGQKAIGHFQLAPSPDMPAGTYPIVIGLYHPETLERLPLIDASAQAVGDSLTLGLVSVVKP